MKKDLTELVFILDRSGSMGGLEADTIGGFNSLIAKQKKEEGEAYVSVVLFDDRTEILYDRTDLKKVEPMTDKEYYVRGCTALLDAVGGAIHHIKKLHKETSEAEVPEKTLFIITTDGMENASRQYTYEKVKKMVEKAKEKRNWEFMFLGANIDAVKVAGNFGINANRAVRYECDSVGTELNYNVIGNLVSRARKASCAREMTACFDENNMLREISEDYAELEEYGRMSDDVPSLSKEELENLKAVMPGVSARDRRVCELVFGLAGNAACSYADAASSLGIPEARVKQSVGKVMKKIS